MPPPPTLAVFAKSPLPGQVKTRLCPPLSFDQAARLAAAFVQDTVRTVQPYGPVTLFCSGDRRTLQECLTDLAPVAWMEQGAGDLGARLARVPAPCVIVGTDCPHLPPEAIPYAVAALASQDLVLGPAEDGGYYLIALRAPQPALFEGIAWSTDAVFDQTRARAESRGLRVALLPRCYDIDTIDDLRRLHADLAADRILGCPATRAALAGMPQGIF